MNKYFTIFFIGVMLLTSCEPESGYFESREFDFTRFDKLHLDISGEVHVSQGNYFSITLEGYTSTLDNIEVSARGDEICIESHGWVGNNYDVYITMPILKSINHKGSGRVIGETVFDQRGDIEFDVRSSGDLDFEIYCDDIELLVAGSGDVYLYGDIDKQEVTSRSSGNYYGFGLESQEAEIVSRGSGNSEIWVWNKLDARITGSGSVFFLGRPRLFLEVKGSGDIYDAN